MVTIPLGEHTTHPPAAASDLTAPDNVVATSTVARDLDDHLA